MKKFYFLFFTCILLWSMKLTAQCGVSAGQDITITCGGSAQLTADPKWVLMNSGTTNDLLSLYFTDSNTGYAAGVAGTILKTIDSGTNWISQTSGTTNAIKSLSFYNSQIGYAFGGEYGETSTVQLKTINGGSSWTRLPNTPFPYSNYSICFVNKDTGYIAADLSVYKTIDGGLTWSYKSSGTSYQKFCIRFTDSMTGYVAGSNGSIYKTINGADLWTSQTSGTDKRLKSIFFLNENTGYIVGEGGTILKTTNGGVNWVKQITSVTDDLNSVFFISSTTGYIVGANGTILKTINGGDNWVKSTSVTTKPLNSVFFTGPNTGYIAGGSGTLLKLSLPDSYSWSPVTGLNNSSIPNPITTTSETTFYEVTTNSNGCIAKDTIKVLVSPLTANAGADKAIVCGGTAQLNTVTTNYTGNGRLRYKWTPTTGLNNDTIAGPTATVTNDMTYTVTVTTPNGCTATDDIKVTINPLTANAGADRAIVCGGTAQLNTVTTNYTGNGRLKYKWTPTIGLNNDTIANPTATVINDITYTVTVTTPNGCTATDDIKVIVNLLTANAGAGKTIICGGTAQLNPVTTNYTGNGRLKYQWTPTTGLNNDTIADPTATVIHDITYTVTVTTPNGCPASANVSVTIIPMDKPEIGIVGVSSNNKNLIAWNKPVSSGIESYFIYRETNVTNVYEKIGAVPYDSMSIYIDNQSFPDVQANKYKLSILDRHGLETSQSNFHKTMHLAINKGMGSTWNLSWEAYEGFVVSTYNIYRGTTPANLTLLGSTSGGNTQYNDINAPVGDVYYQLEVINPNVVNPTKVPYATQKVKTAEDGSSMSLLSYRSSRSNIASNVVNGINGVDGDNRINIYPNPVKNEFRIDFEGGSTFEILNLMGQVVYNGNLIKNTTVQMSNLPTGVYLIKFKTVKTFEYKKIIKE